MFVSERAHRGTQRIPVVSANICGLLAMELGFLLRHDELSQQCFHRG
jgi:hypothetical protein